MGITLRHLFASVVLMAVCCATAKMELSLDRYSRQATTQNVIVSFKGQIESVIDKINKLKFKTIVEKRTALTNAQIAFSDNDQAEVQKYLKTKVVDYETIWINNKMVVYKADDALIKQIKTFKTVVSVDEDEEHILDFDVGGHEGGNGSTKSVRQSEPTIQWGIQKIRADLVWANYKGKGVVVAGIDSGVRHTHEALKANWRRDYGWYDPITRTTTPYDETGHGTHTMGIIAGNVKGIGVAPEATWIACKACYKLNIPPVTPKSVCYSSALMICGQWAQCPTSANAHSKDCSKAPRIVSNSWGKPVGGKNYFDTILKSWHAVEILPVFAIGNSGRKGCGSVVSPGDRPDAFGVGNTDEQDRISPGSSLGPSPDASTSFKPDISAPGTKILSASNSGDNLYVEKTGTSMACPHVSGVAALMVNKNPFVSNAEITDAIKGSAVTRELDTLNAPKCGGVPPTTFPNYVFGHGRIDAFSAMLRI